MKINRVIGCLACASLVVLVFSGASVFGQVAPATCADDMATVAVPSTTAGDTNPASGAGGGFSMVGPCLTEYSGGPGFAVGAQWFSFIGTGNTITVSLCPNELGNNDATMTVFCGSCDVPMCAGTSEDACGGSGWSPEVTFCSEVGVRYWAVVGDNFAPQADFNIDIWDDATACATPPSCTPDCGNDSLESGEECDGTANAACEVTCEGDCTCTPDVCGNDVRHGAEECDGTDKDACILACDTDGSVTGNPCTCVPVPTPMLPKWGLVGLALMLILGGAAVFGRGRMGVQQA